MQTYVSFYSEVKGQWYREIIDPVSGLLIKFKTRVEYQTWLDDKRNRDAR